ncbi:MAG: DUF1015 family protein [Acidimicrobiia bacterium]
MPALRAFPGIRYDLDHVGARLDALTAPPYDVIDEEERAALEQAHPLNSVRLILPREQAPGDAPRRSAKALANWRAEGWLKSDPPGLYAYAIDHDARASKTTVGVLGALELALPSSGAVLPHERTMPKPKGDRLELLRAVRANLDPIWLLSLASGLTELLGAEASGAASGACRSTDGALHRVGQIVDPELVRAIGANVASAPVVIADGHHRYETALAYQEECRAAGLGAGPHDAILAYVVELGGTALSVEPIHRLLQGTRGAMSLKRLLEASFSISPVESSSGETGPARLDELLAQMEHRGGLGLVDAEGLASLELRPGADSAALAPVAPELRDVPATWFDALVLPALGSPAPSVSYRNDARTVTELVYKGSFDAAVLLRPVPVERIRSVALAGLQMPPKTTYFRPKPCTGMVMRALDV